VSANQTVTIEYDETRFASSHNTRLFPNGEEIEVHSRSSQRVLSARWSYNTTNEPILPTRGTLLHVTPFVARQITRRTELVFPNPGNLPDALYQGDSYGLEVGAAQYWEVSDPTSIFGEVRGGWERVELYSDTLFEDFRGARGAHYGSIGAGISRSLWSRERRANGGDSRIDLSLRYANRTRDDFDRPPNIPNPGRDVRQFSASWLRRTSWGTLRFGAGYAW